jgi:hypothetical protein
MILLWPEVKEVTGKLKIIWHEILKFLFFTLYVVPHWSDEKCIQIFVGISVLLGFESMLAIGE